MHIPVKEKDTLKSLKIILRAGSTWDLAGGIIFLLIHGLLLVKLTPPIYPFYSIVIGLFLFVLAYIQFLTACNIKRYCANIGIVIFLRSAYAFTVLLYSLLRETLPAQFIFIAIVDTVFTLLQIYYAYRATDIKVRNLFFPAYYESNPAC